MLIRQRSKTLSRLPDCFRVALACAAVAGLGASVSVGWSQELSEGEMALLRDQIIRCLSIPAEAVDAKTESVSVKFELDRSGTVKGNPEIVSGARNDRLAQSVIRAVARCAPYNLPADKYDAWANVIVNFDPSEMF